MHYPDGDGYTTWDGKRIFTNGSAGVADGTTIEENILNALVLEVANAIVGGGGTINEATETKEQMVQLLAAMSTIAAVPLWTATGASNQYAITPSPAISSLTNGEKFRFKANHTSIYVPPTLNYGCELKINDLAYYRLVKADGTDLDDDGAIQSGQYVTATWNSTLSKFFIEVESNRPFEAVRSEVLTARGVKANLNARISQAHDTNGDHLMLSLYEAFCHVTISGGTPTLYNHQNCAGCTKEATGQFKVTFTTGLGTPTIWPTFVTAEWTGAAASICGTVIEKNTNYVIVRFRNMSSSDMDPTAFTFSVPKHT